jgi:diacylglycerol kinase (ATP)
MLQSIAFAINPQAGNGKSLKMANLLSEMLGKKKIHHQFFKDDWPATFAGFTDVWIIGGDGTLNYFLNHYPSIHLPLVIFKGGTGNDFAWKLYGNSSIKEQFDQVIKATPKLVDAAICNDILFMNGVGIGFDGNILQSMKAIRFIGGHFGYYLAVLKEIISFKESSFKIYSDHLISDDKYLLVMINNSSRTGGGFHVSPKASVNDGLLDLVIAKPLSILKRFFYLPRIEKGKHLKLSFVQHITSEKFIVECEKELPAQLDGEFIKAKRFTFSVLKNKYLFRY